jgi:hypothetical protein
MTNSDNNEYKKPEFKQFPWFPLDDIEMWMDEYQEN